MNNARHQALAAYRSAAAQVHPHVAVVKLYDLAIRSIRLAILAKRERRVEDTYVAITKACQVLRGLSANLRGDTEIAQELKSTYIANMVALHNAFGKPEA